MSAPRAHGSASRRTKVLDLVEAGRPVAQVAADLDISDQTIYVWRRQHLIGTGQLPGTTSAENAELIAARRRIAELEAEVATGVRAQRQRGRRFRATHAAQIAVGEPPRRPVSPVALHSMSGELVRSGVFRQLLDLGMFALGEFRVQETSMIYALSSLYGRAWLEPTKGTRRMPRPETRYILPSFVERTSYGNKETNPYNKLFEERIVFVGTAVDDVSANDIAAQLICLEGEDPDRDIELYINSPGGSLTAMAALYDTMRYIRPHIRTVCLGQAVSAAALLLAAGQPGKRALVPHARISISQPSTEGLQGDASDLDIQVTEITRLRRMMESALCETTGTTIDKVHNDIDRQLLLDAEQALEYGLVDHVITSRKLRSGGS